MRQNQYLATLAAAAALMFGVQARAAIIEVGTAQGEAGTTAVLSVDLNTQGAEVAGTQNDIAFPADAPVAAKANGRPDCTATVKLDGSQFAFQPPGCTGTACTGIRAIIISFSDLSPIPDGSELYTCNIAIASSATGTQALTCSGAGASDPDGGAIATTCTNGSVVVGPPAEGTPTATPTEVAGGTTIHVGSTSGNVGQPDLDFTTSLETDSEVAGTQNDITFSGGVGAAISIPAKANGRPDCTALVKQDGSQFAFQPPGCSGEACTGIRAIIISFSDLSPIPSGTDLYTCKITINGTAEDGQSYPLTCSGAGASDPDGGALPTSCTNGAVAVGGPIFDTPTASPTATTSGIVNTPTATPSGAVNTPTRTPPTVVPPPTFVCDDGCAITSPANTQSGWLLLLPAAMLIWLRRRSR